MRLRRSVDRVTGHDSVAVSGLLALLVCSGCTEDVDAWSSTFGGASGAATMPGADTSAGDEGSSAASEAGSDGSDEAGDDSIATSETSTSISGGSTSTSGSSASTSDGTSSTLGESTSPSSTTASDGCGDGIAEGSEECDGDDLQGQTCSALDHIGGSLGCNADCTVDTSDCGPECGGNGEGCVVDTDCCPAYTCDAIFGCG